MGAAKRRSPGPSERGAFEIATSEDRRGAFEAETSESGTARDARATPCNRLEAAS
ncbi:hypothetical protein [Natronosalvus caseinilyticus]|uniref:hypothetical protein n=1 Tax=Natronosalvus caseinilyticus TaxID=2953747 RepID=UPI0028ADD242|nr:hypothetical protein [Natronosalvus caseinilyticus]